MNRDELLTQLIAACPNRDLMAALLNIDRGDDIAEFAELHLKESKYVEMYNDERKKNQMLTDELTICRDQLRDLKERRK
jgi:hypothetical protein